MSKHEPSADGQSAIGDAVDKVTDRVSTAYASARGAANDAVHNTATGIDSNPFAALLGGIALGAVAGMLIPRIAKEKELLEPLGARFGDAARAALEAGRSAGVAALADAGFGPDNLRAQASRLVGQALGAASDAGTAAFGAARDAAAK